MTNKNNTLEKLLTKIISIARESALAIMHIYLNEQNFQKEQKSDSSPVTIADLKSHEIIYNELKKLTPKLPVLSEESKAPEYSERKNWSRYWLIDPLDGTKEFIAKNGEFAINIALIEENLPVLGVVYLPVTNEAYAARINGGSFKVKPFGGKNIIQTRKTQYPVKLVASRRHGSKKLDALLNRIESYQITLYGSAAKMCLVAEGKADIYPRFGPTSEWDTAAGHIILKEAGGKLFCNNFKERYYNTSESLLNPNFFAVGDPYFNWEYLLK